MTIIITTYRCFAAHALLGRLAAGPRSRNLDVQGSDSVRFSILRGEIPRFMGNFR